MTDRRVTALVLLAGCNEILGLDPTVSRPPHSDAPIDAPFQCPAPGVTPAFNSLLRQHLFQDVSDYVPTRTGRAFGTCNETLDTPICEGPVEGPLAPIRGIPPVDTSAALRMYPRPSPDGERLLVYYFDFLITVTEKYEYYARNSDGSFRALPDPPFTLEPFVGTLAIAPSGYLALVTRSDKTVHEWVDEAGTWRELRQHPDIGAGVQTISLTADGLRALVFTSAATLYTDRANLDATFRQAVPLDGLPPGNTDGYLSEDCARVYMSSLGYVFYVQQR